MEAGNKMGKVAEKLEVGHYYRLRDSGNEQKIMVVHRAQKSGLGALLIDYQYFGSEEIRKGKYTVPNLWEEI